MTLKKALGKIHLWLGLISGAIVVVSMLAAAVFAWDSELNEWYHSDKIFVKEVSTTTLGMQALTDSANSIAGGYPVASVKISDDPRKAYEFSSYKKSDKPSWTWASGMDAYSRIYVDQYSGRVLGKIDLRYDWIFCTRMLHQCLLLNYDVGHYIVGGATLIIFIMVITGIVLWWPRNMAALKQRIWFRWKPGTRWRRKNYDLHNIGGIYIFFFVLILAVTGLVWTFDWWTDSIYRLMGNDPKTVFRKAPPPAPSAFEKAGVLDLVLADAKTKREGWYEIGMGLMPVRDGKPKDINVFVRYSSGKSGWQESDYYSYHPATAEMYFSTPHDQKTLGAKWRNSNYAIHVGSIYGYPTKIVATLVALYCASLPISGFLIWYGRKKRTRKKIMVVPAKRSVEVVT